MYLVASTSPQNRARMLSFAKDSLRKLEREHETIAARDRARARDRERSTSTAETLRLERERERRAARANELRARAEREALRALNEGASYAETLVVEASDEARRRGIRARAEDKARLPASAGAALGASRSGRAHFRVEVGDRVAHVGVLDYGGVATGTIGLPYEVMARLGLGADARGTSARVTYAALPSATRMTLRPKTNDFARDFAAEDVREVLERVMMGRSAAAVGDEIQVTRGERTYALTVAGVEPDDGHGAVSLLETDVEVDLEPSEEYEEFVNRERRRREEFERAKEALAEREREREERARDAEARRTALRESIAREPENTGDASIATIRFSLPNGAIKTRRFDCSRESLVRDVFDYVKTLDDDLFSGDGFALTTRRGDVVLREDDGARAVDASHLHAQTFFVKR